MSRSFRKTPVFGITTVKSEKQDKRIANRVYRRACRTPEFDSVMDIPPYCWFCAGTGDNPEAPGGCPRCPWPITHDEVVVHVDSPKVRELSSVWSFGKDGKNYWCSADKADMRK